MKSISDRSVLIVLLFALVTVSACEFVENPTYIDSPEYEAAAPGGKYRILPGDELEIRFFHTPDLNVTLPVRPDGHVALPYVGEVEAAGRTAEELTAEITRGYDKELRNPDIAVIVRSFSAYQVHVGGQVKRPGVFPLAGPMTVIDSLFAAGGVNQEGLLSEVVVLRRTPDDFYLVIPVDVESILNGVDVRDNIRLLPYDAVYVPNSPIANVNEWVDLYIRKNVPVNFSIRPETGSF